MRNQPTWLWELRTPIICHPQTEQAGKLVVLIPHWIWRPESQRSQWCKFQVKPRRLMSQLNRRQEVKWLNSFSTFVLLRPLRDWVMSLVALNLQIQMLISSRTSFLTVEKRFNPATPMPMKSTLKTKYHTTTMKWSDQHHYWWDNLAICAFCITQ